MSNKGEESFVVQQLLPYYHYASCMNFEFSENAQLDPRKLYKSCDMVPTMMVVVNLVALMDAQGGDAE